MARYLVTGVDVWLNNPLRPLEASGTSGMKAALNGALNLSILDGWWDEWYDGENGWAIPSAEGLSDPDHRDDLEANALYDLIEKNVAPRFYDRTADGIPTRWVQMVRHTLKSLGPKVLAGRMVAEYVQRLYVPAAASSRRMFADDFAAARELATWRRRVEGNWPAVAVLHVDSQLSGSGDAQLGESLTLRAEVALGDLHPSDVDVEAVYGTVAADDRLTDTAVAALRPVPNGDGTHRFEGEIPLDRTGGYGYTVRVLPKSELLASPAELGLVASA
jgi:starch phosphorylase